jgi:hypothetical protein
MAAATETVPERANNRTVLFVSIAAALGGFLFGFDTAIVNGTVDEMFNNTIRATALAVAAAAQWLANWAISTSFPRLAEIGLSFAYGLYAFFAALALVFVTRAVHETKGRTLESM